MAEIVIIRDHIGIVAVEMREGKLEREALQIILAVKDGFGFSRGKDTTVIGRSLNYEQRYEAAEEIRTSDRFTPEQREEYIALLGGRPLHIDYYRAEFRPGGVVQPPASQTTDGGGGDRPVIVRFIDP